MYENINNFVSNTDKNVFAIANLPEEVIAVLFAYYSRSKESLRDNMVKLLKDDIIKDTESNPGDFALAGSKASEFHKKWVVGYSHQSVAEHAVVHLAVEGCSILASKAIEDARLASYTEKSTRYVQFTPDSFHTPSAIVGTPLETQYVDVCRRLMTSYLDSYEKMLSHVKASYPQQDGVPLAAYNASCRAKALDSLRYLLPASTTTNIGITANARTLQGMISKLATHPSSECKAIAEDMKVEASKIVPTLLRHADRNDFKAKNRLLFTDNRRTNSVTPTQNSAQLIAWNGDIRDIVTALRYEGNSLSYLECYMTSKRENYGDALEHYFEVRGAHDTVDRAFESVRYDFEVLVDYGAYRDIQRHRMTTQTAKLLNCYEGYETPQAIIEIGMRSEYDQLMADTAKCYETMIEAGLSRHDAAYVLPMAYRVRLMISMNLREAFHFIELRSSPQGHESYRKIAQDMYREISNAHPWVAKYIRVNMDGDDIGRLNAEVKIHTQNEN